jgi:hypothetical protein
MFRATQDQRLIRARVADLLQQEDAPPMLMSQIVATVDGLTMATFNRWWDQPGFADWWAEMIDVHGNIHPVDLLHLDQLGMRALLAALKAGEGIMAWNKHQTTRATLAARQTDAEADVDMSVLEGFFAPGAGSTWTSPDGG